MTQAEGYPPSTTFDNTPNRYSGNDQIKALLTLETPGQEDRNFSKNQNEWKGHVGGSYGRRLFII